MKKGMVWVLVLAALVLSSCGTSVSKQFVTDSVNSVLAVSPELLTCREIAISPTFVVDVNNLKAVQYGGGMFISCLDAGVAGYFGCVTYLDPVTTKPAVKCDRVSTWHKDAPVVVTP